MDYDFTSISDRRAIGSRKWDIIPEEIDPLSDKLYPMTVADMDFALAPEIKTALQNFIGQNILGYSEPTDNYRATVCSFIEKWHKVSIEPEWIVTTPGVLPALSASIRAFSDVGDGVLVFTPVYPRFYQLVREQGRKLIACPLEIAQDELFHIDFAHLEALLETKEIKIILLCNPHNPSGRVWTASDLQRLAKLAKEYDCLVVSDEIHADLTFADNDQTMYFKALSDFQEAAIVCTSAAKAFNIAGLQCANIIIPRDDLRSEFQAALLSAGIQNANILGLYATEIAYSSADKWRLACLEVLKTNFQLVCDFFAELDNRFEVMPSQASFLAWINCEKLHVDREQLKAVFQAICFFVADGAAFGEAGAYYFRLNYALPTAELKACLETFAEKISPYLHSVDD